MSTMLDSKKKTKLLDNWNLIFKSSISNLDVNEVYDTDTLFNNFLIEYHKGQKYEYNENICVCIKNNGKINLYSANDNKIEFIEMGLNTRKKFKNYVNNYDIVITNFRMDQDLIQNYLKINPNKIFLRYEILHSSFSGGKSNFISNNVAFPDDNPTAYLTKEFYRHLTKNQTQLSFLSYSSFLLNHFESGIMIGDLIIKPKINVSDYGRWYWSGTYKLQQDKDIRDSIINNIKDIDGKYVSIDFVSASPSMLSKITGSKTISYLVKNRLKNKDNTEYADGIKKILNVYIHSGENPNKNYDMIRKKVSVDLLENVGKFNLMEILNKLHEELTEYNVKMIDTYKSLLSFNELKRRIVNSSAIIEDDKDIIKKHRVYLQGHIHDSIILLSKYVYEKTGVFPLYTIHDSISFYLDRTKDYDKFIEIIKGASKEIKLPYIIEEY